MCFTTRNFKLKYLNNQIKYLHSKLCLYFIFFKNLFFKLKNFKNSKYIFRKHAISEDKIEELANVANLSKRINLVNNDDEALNDSFSNEFSDYFPQLIWVLRDFSLDKGDKTPK